MCCTLIVFLKSRYIGPYTCYNIDANKVFHKLPEQDTVSWMITRYGQQGHGAEALQLFFQMQRLAMKGD